MLHWFKSPHRIYLELQLSQFCIKQNGFATWDKSSFPCSVSVWQGAESLRLVAVKCGLGGSSESACGAGTSSAGHEVVKGLPREAVNEAIADCLKCEQRHCPASPWASHY